MDAYGMTDNQEIPTPPQKGPYQNINPALMLEALKQSGQKADEEELQLKGKIVSERKELRDKYGTRFAKNYL